jgi:hypothetical protein
MSKLGRNDPCRCGSGKKYKTCCLDKDEAAERAARAKTAEDAAAAPPAEPAATGKTVPRPQAHQPWKGHANTRGFTRINATRKVGGG